MHKVKHLIWTVLGSISKEKKLVLRAAEVGRINTLTNKGRTAQWFTTYLYRQTAWISMLAQPPINCVTLGNN